MKPSLKVKSTRDVVPVRLTRRHDDGRRVMGRMADGQLASDPAHLFIQEDLVFPFSEQGEGSCSRTLQKGKKKKEEVMLRKGTGDFPVAGQFSFGTEIK